MKITNYLSRVLAATLLGLGCHTAALHAQNIMLRLDARKASMHKPLLPTSVR